MSARGFISLDAERVVSQAASTFPGGSASPANATMASPCLSRRMAGDALDAERRPGGPRRHEQVVAGECQCSGQLVPAAHRFTRCPLCESPVIYRLHNENGRGRCARPGRTQEVVTPMPNQHYRFAVDLLDRAWINHEIRDLVADSLLERPPLRDCHQRCVLALAEAA